MLNENQTELATIDLFATNCRSGMTVEIEGFKPMGTYHLPRPNLATAIAHVYVLCTGRAVVDLVELAKRITVTGLDKGKKRIRVNIKPE